MDRYERHVALYERDDTYGQPDGWLDRYRAIYEVIEVTDPQDYRLDGEGEAWNTVYDLLDMVTWLRGKYVQLRVEMEQVRGLLPDVHRAVESNEIRLMFAEAILDHRLGEEGDR